MQGYDSVVSIDVDGEIGGNDQVIQHAFSRTDLLRK